MKRPKRDPWKKVLAAVRDMERKLALSWPTDYKKDPEAETCRINSDPVKRRHLVTLPSYALDNFEEWRPSAAHELCHAWLAENVDPIFSAWRFPHRCRAFVGQEKAEFQHRVQEMYLATSFLIDVWVNDLRHTHWPEVTQQELMRTADDLLLTVRAKRVRTLCEGVRIMAIALHVVSSERYATKPMPMDEIYAALPTNVVQVIQEIVQFLQSVPTLAHERRTDVLLLEQYTQRSAQLLNASFIPRIVEEEGILVWELMA